MTFIGKNIRKIRNIKGLSQAAFAELFDITRASVGAYEEGRAEPKLEMIILIAKHFSISIDLLLKKELTVNELYRFDIFDTEIKSGEQEHSSSALPAGINEDMMELVRSEDVLRYLKNYDNESYVMSLPKISFPLGFLSGTRIFELKGADGVSNLSAHIGDVLLASRVKDADWKKLDEDRLHLFINQDELIVNTSRSLKSKLEGDFTPGEIWEVHSQIYLSTQRKLSVEERITILERKVAQLSKND